MIYAGTLASAHVEGWKHEPQCPGTLVIPPDAGIYCADDERCILDAGHDGEHVYEIGAC
jgi:hypothetical protein